jgi:hypothetical protein
MSKQKSASSDEKEVQRVVMERLVKLGEHDRSFDIEFWQTQASQARFDAALESAH